MANYTPSCNLKKPAGDEFYSIEDQNGNLDIIDENIGNLKKIAHGAVADLAALKAINTTNLADNIIIIVKSLGFYRFDSTSSLTADDNSIIKPNTGPGRWLNEITALDKKVTSHQADNLYQTAGGTGTAITLTISGSLVTGYPITFIASANNNGAATTINSKPLYKPGTTISPTLISGKAYTVWYNSSGNSGNGCFFIKASAEGTATTAQVLAGVPFSNENDTGLVGTMPKRGDEEHLGWRRAIVDAVQPFNGRAHFSIPLGAYITPNSQQNNNMGIFVDDPNFIASNILSGKSIFGLAGMATVASLGGKRWATGTVSVDWNNNSDTGKVIVSGLSFTPSMVFVYRTATPSIAWSCYVRDYNTDKQVYIERTGFTYLSGNGTYVTNGGFKLYGSADSTGVFISNTWIAIE